MFSPRRPLLRSLLFASFCPGLLFATSCASPQPQVDPFQIADETQAPTSLLDEPVPTPRQHTRRPSQTTDFQIEEALPQPNRAVNARTDGWDLSRLRWFEGSEFVREGRENWAGKDDASFAVTLDSDSSHLYFWIEVIDDQILSSNPQNPLDGVVITLRDVGLESLRDSLPLTLQDRVTIHSETAIVITPNGEWARYQSSAPIPPGAIHVATAPIADEGYVVEVALSLEIFPQVHRIPLKEIAFRVELFDTDDPDARAPEKILTMLPRAADASPRFALYTTAGLLPAISPTQGPPRFDAFGLWQQRRDGWNYQTLEHISPQWSVLEDLRAVASEVTDRSALPSICTDPETAMWLVEAYQSRREDHRVALVLCGTDVVSNRCPTNSQTQLIWASIRQQGPDDWVIDRTEEVFPEPLPQCPFEGRPGEQKFSGFSLLPLDVIGPSLWGVGWHMEHQASREFHRESGVFLVDPRAPSFRTTEISLQRHNATGNRRWLRNNQVYLTHLQDGDPHMGICEIVVVEDQQCSRLNTECETVPRGRETLTHVKTYNEERRRFEDILLRPHPRCRPSVDFSQTGAVEIFLVHDRLGLLR